MTKRKSPTEISPPLSEFETKLLQTFRALDINYCEHIVRMAENLAKEFPRHKKPMLTLVSSRAKGGSHA